VKQINQIEILSQSAWNICKSVREGIIRAGLPVPTADYLHHTFSATHWKKIDRAIAALRDRFCHARFGDKAVFGALLVPDPAKLDTRGAVDPAIRLGQAGEEMEDFVDQKLPAGKLLVQPGEGLVGGRAVSGTVLYNKVRFRLGKPDRGTSVVRVCPALLPV